MATSLFKVPFDIEKIRVKQIYGSSSLDQAQMETITREEMKGIYGDLKFGTLHEDYSHTHTSLVTSIDDRTASAGASQGSLIARLNKYDGGRAGTDWWIPNMFKAVSDGDIIGAGTMNVESDYIARVFSQQLEDVRVAAGMEPAPWDIISLLDVTDVPFDHVLLKTEETPMMIGTSATGVSVTRKKTKEDYYLVGPVKDTSEVTEEMIEFIKVNWNKVPVIATDDEAPGSKVALYTIKKFGPNKVLVETPSYMYYLVSRGTINELLFNYSYIYVGGQTPIIGKFGQELDSEDHPHTRMLNIHSHSDHFFYFRHKLIYG